ncbi:hypothetical protein [Peterkaempfera griseoplana]|uniref:hypothetical protein n=1 Tax=Peterkaempfera griseoplana TaxID=66896 RepID=UPI0006E2BE85|nr:hypothetical protein [Peterkaempfera griseoplana]
MHEMRAEHGPAELDGDRPVDFWHVVASGADVALCGRELHRDAAVQPVQESEPAAEQYCEPCLAAFREKVTPVTPATP